MAVPLRADFDAVGVRCWARKSKDGPQARRLLALAAIYEGASRTEAARIGGVTLQIVRDWVLKFNADGPAGLIDRKAPGQPPRLNDAHRATLAAITESGPIPAVHGIARWRIVDLCQWILRGIPRRHLPADPEPGIARHGLSQAFGRPRHHAQAAGAIEDFKKRMARPSASGFVEIGCDQSASTYPASKVSPSGQDGDTRAPVLIKLTASSAVF